MSEQFLALAVEQRETATRARRLDVAAKAGGVTALLGLVAEDQPEASRG